MESLIDYINKYTSLDKESESAIKEYAEMEFHRKNTNLIEPGMYCGKIWFLKSGMIRCYYLRDGKEITKWIHLENEMFTAMSSYFGGKASDEYLECCEDSELISMSADNSRKLNEYPQIALFSKKVVEEQLYKIFDISKQFSLMSPVEKYNMLFELRPGLFQKAKLIHIASIMGVSPETVSRIRAKK